MKNILLSFALLLAALHLWGQNNLPTYGYNYQAVIRNAAGTPLPSNTPVQLRFRILSASDQNLYEETHSTTTDAFGRVALVVGAGTPAGTAKFDTLSWAARKHFLDVAVKIGGAANWVDLGKEEVVQQPLAKGSSLWQANGQNIYRLGENVGVGISSPESKFHVNGATFLNQGALAGTVSQKPALLVKQHSDLADPNQTAFEVVGGVTDLQPKKFKIYTENAPYHLRAEFEGRFLIHNWDYLGPALEVSNNAVEFSQSSERGGEHHLPALAVRQHSDLADPNQTAFEVVGGVTDLQPKKFKIYTENGDPWNLKALFDGTFRVNGFLDVNGDARVKTLTILGNDRAHFFPTVHDQCIAPGTVVVFDEAQPGRVRPCTSAYDRKMPGVVSDLHGAGKYRPGIVHAQEGTDTGVPVALDGTVEVLAVGPVAIGDYLTTSAVPGHAMAAKSRRKAEGAVIGRAITPLGEGEKGKVDVFVGRQ